MIVIFNIFKREITLGLNLNLTYWALPLAVSWSVFKSIYTSKYLTFSCLCFNFTIEIWDFRDYEATDESR